MTRSRHGRRRQRGTIDELPSGALRVRVYAGTDPLTGTRHDLVEVIPPSPKAETLAEAARTRLLSQVDERRNPRTNCLRPLRGWRVRLPGHAPPTMHPSHESDPQRDRRRARRQEPGRCPDPAPLRRSGELRTSRVMKRGLSAWTLLKRRRSGRDRGGEDDCRCGLPEDEEPVEDGLQILDTWCVHL
jgi:hypothetical protein